MRTLKITHMSSAHARTDTRIFLKMCRSIAQAGHEVTLIIADGLGDAVVEGVTVLDVGKAQSRMERMRKSPRLVQKKALSTQADIYHFHDPELLMVARGLKKTGSQVIFDAHEDTAKQILTKHYLPAFTRQLIAYLYHSYEKRALKYIDLVIAATPKICEKFSNKKIKSITINNYPILGELETRGVDWTKKKNIACYVGGITKIRGAIELAQAAKAGEDKFIIKMAGKTTPSSLNSEMSNITDKSLLFLGNLDRQNVRQLLSESCAGLVTFLPAPNHIEAQPNKMFEYMSAGLPVIGSNFPMWRDIIEGSECGICVDPEDPNAIATAINYLIDNPSVAEKMGNNGQKATIEKYNWASQAEIMLDAYSQLKIS